VVKRAEDLGDPEAIVAAINGTNLDTIVGNVNWANGPINNVSKTPLVAGQWQKDGDAMDLKIVANSAAPNIPLTGELKLLG
jgi:branched-chain amino acid transport system substrate-binding protein